MNEIRFEAQDLNQQGKVLLKAGNVEAAREKFEKAIEIDPMYAESYKNCGDLCLFSGEFTEAKNFYKKALLIKKDGETYFMYGSACALNGEYHEGIENYNAAMQEGYDTDELYYFTALAYEHIDNDTMALRYYHRASIKNPVNPEYVVKRIGIYLQRHDIDKAEECVDELIKISPQSFEGYHFKTTCLNLRKNHEEAVLFSKAASDKFPEDVELLADYIKSLALNNQKDKALELIEQAKKMQYYNDVKAQIVYLEAQINAENQNFDKAIQLCRECIALDSIGKNEGRVRFMLMNMLFVKEEFEETLEQTEEIIKLNKQDEFYTSALYFKAVCLKRLERKEEATKAYKEAISIFRVISFKRPEAIDAYMYRAVCHKDLEEYDKALELLDFIQNLNVNVAEVYTIRADIYKTQGKMVSMKQELEKAYALKPELRQFEQ